MPKPNKTVAMRQLDNLGIAYTIIWQDVPTFDSESAAVARNLPITQIVKSLLVEMPGRKYCLVLLQGDRKLSLHKLGAFLGLKGLAMAKHEEVVDITGYEPGSVCPFGLKKRLPVIVDTGVMSEAMISISGGRHEAGISLKPDDLVRAANAKVADVSQ